MICKKLPEKICIPQAVCVIGVLVSIGVSTILPSGLFTISYSCVVVFSTGCSVVVVVVKTGNVLFPYLLVKYSVQLQ